MMSDRSDTSPVLAIIRVAGLPSTAITALRAPKAMADIDALLALEAQLEALREQTSDAIFETLSNADPDSRRYLLRLKRDCFNGRSVRKHKRAPYWQSLQRWIGDLGERLVASEEEIAAVSERFSAHYFSERDAARRHLRSLTRESALMRGITLASPRLVEHIDRLHEREVDSYRRRELKVAHSFLRYASRAAAKLSPYSTLGKLALAGIRSEPDDTGPAVRYLARTQREHSLVRVKRYLLDQCCRLLLFHNAVRDRMVLTVNATTEDRGDGLYRFLRPMVLTFNEDSGDLQHAQPSIVQVRLRGPLIEWLRSSLAQPNHTYAEALQNMQSHFDTTADSIEPTLAKLIEIGFLRLIPPWASHEIHLEPRLLRFLQAIPDEPSLRPSIEVLERLVAVESEFADAAEPLQAVREIDSLVPELFARIRAAARPESKLSLEKAEHNYYEDLFIYADEAAADAQTPSPAPAREILHLDRSTAKELVDAGGLLFSLSNLYEPRYEFQHALFHYVAEKWPGQTQIPFLEFFATVQPLLEKYLAYLAQPSGGVFNPYQLDEIDALTQLRERIQSEFVALYTEDEDGLHLPEEALRALVAEIPANYRRMVESCLFVQPADATGTRWVANRFFESTGRFSCRYTAVLGDDTLPAYIERFERGGRIQVDGEEVEFLDMLFTRGNTVSLHWPQTPKVLEIPGERADVPESKRRLLRDLVIAVEPERGRCVVRDLGGQRYLPCFLSPLQQEYLPSIFKLLDVFGCIPRTSLRLHRPTQRRDDIEIHPRLQLGRLVVLRKRWIIPIDSLPQWPNSEQDAFLAIQRWRLNYGIPRQCFLIEQVTAAQTTRNVFKPQYIDFGAPELVSLFRSASLLAKGSITLEEALPTPDDFPENQHGEPQGVEIILEGMTLV
ncbi:lantibiotic dehydratase [Haliangium ochraceum]|uniref:Lantibiotic dehydratase domain protein n=1 Tax=Haliangium ochraceum (strain DSM 14365 / JCM 11303 / SMP-2) TaxID=502025 RepID=D0LVQ8_HALO1|nr:lantibiotic dehydratase [Haliangium ochraceum]ACY14042.1 Lantibiotic dehydratase domain protein [Haliangium ochraceum DSM 14365]